MRIGLECFQDEQLRSMIISEHRLGRCDVYGRDDCIIYDTDEDSYLAESLAELLDVFTVAKRLNADDADDRVRYLGSFFKEWKLFSAEEAQIQEIVKAICSERYQEEPELFDEKVTIREFFSAEAMEKNCILENGKWDDFCYDIKHVNRFHSRQFNFEQLKKLLGILTIDIEKGTLRLFRSRICDERAYSDGFLTREMGAPPIEYATAGRTNSEGIPCLYLAADMETTFHEVRARDYDHVTVGEFIQTEDLKLVDFSLLDKIGPFSSPDFDKTWFAINIGIIRKIGDEVAKPMRRFDRTLDYIPTQYICDYIKYSGYDGIRFNSTLKNKGINYAVFDAGKLHCIKTEVIEINNVDYRYETFR